MSIPTFKDDIRVFYHLGINMNSCFKDYGRLNLKVIVVTNRKSDIMNKIYVGYTN